MSVKPCAVIVVKVYEKDIQMNKEQKIVDKFGREPGFKVPERFLEEVYSTVAEKRGDLPMRELKAERVSRWHKLRPYVYLAAMFAGIWCMMKVFTTASEHIGLQPNKEIAENVVSLDNPPQLIAQALEQPEVISELQIKDEISSTTDTDMELEQEMQASYNDFEEFEAAFDYKFEEKYSDINVDEVLAQAI